MTDPRDTGRRPVPLLTFEVARRQFALPAQVLREVVRAVAIAPLPKAPPIVEGVINVRGTVVPVLDIRHRFGLPPVPLAPQQHLLIAHAGPRLVALRVDRAQDLVSVPEDAIASAARIVPRAQYVAGIATLPDGLLVIHDLARFLALDEAEQVDAALADASAPVAP
ncbi:MAG: purine-binding chemotaxis protein CheW [Gemmatimonadetes bacterium]|nr:purine-binding chemotaxis protein CheW [Gemmatimonadota bacterium]